jgi:hypothetical protein
LQLSTFLFYVVTYHFHLLMVCMSHSWFGTQEHVLRMRTFLNEADNLQISWCCKVIMNLAWNHNFANSTVAIMTLLAITNYHWPICWMIGLIQFFILSFPFWLWRRVIPYAYFWLRAHGWCDRSTEDAYSSQAPDPTSVVTRGPCKPYFIGLFHVLDTDNSFDCGFSRSAWLCSTILSAKCSVHLIWTHWFWLPIFEFEVGLTAGVTGRQRILTPPRHLILPLHLLEVRVALHSIL